MINVLSNNSSSITYLIFVFIIFSLTKCATIKKTSRTKREQSSRRATPAEDGITEKTFDETQDVNNGDDNQVAEVLNDYLSNVQLLAPTLPGGCTEENAAKEALGRYSTNAYLPKLEIQEKRILDDTTQFELREMIDALPKHPSRRFRGKNVTDQTAKLRERQEKWKDTHVTWNPIGLVYMVRSSDPCRARDEGVIDTVDSLDADSPDNTGGGEDKVNSEMTMSPRKTMVGGEKNATKKSRTSLRSKKSKRESKKDAKGLKVDKTMTTSEHTTIAEQETQKVNDN